MPFRQALSSFIFHKVRPLVIYGYYGWTVSTGVATSRLTLTLKLGRVSYETSLIQMIVSEHNGGALTI